MKPLLPLMLLRQRTNRRRWALAAGAALAVPWLLATTRAAAAQEGAPQPPMTIDWPVVPLIDGGVIEPADWAGRVSMLVFWATWCPFCKRQNAHLDKLYRRSREQGLNVLAVSVDGDAAKVRQYMNTNGYAFPVALDSAAGLRARVTSRKVIPLTCVVNRQGQLAQTVPGEMFEEDLFDMAKRALAAKA